VNSKKFDILVCYYFVLFTVIRLQPCSTQQPHVQEERKICFDVSCAPVVQGFRKPPLKKLDSLDVNQGEAMAALTGMDLVVFFGCSKLMRGR
jgi:hypothetical protein